MNALERLQALRAAGRLRAVDIHFARLLAAHARHDPARVELAAALAAAALAHGDVCADRAAMTRAGLGVDEIDALYAALRAEPELAGDTGDLGRCPLRLAGERLYLRRYWLAEDRVAARLRTLAATVHAIGPDSGTMLARLFPADSEQRQACAMALGRGLGIVTGGPGTGKTTTLARLLVLLAADAAARGAHLAVQLAAPTGKAAARVGEALGRELARLETEGQVDRALLAGLPRQARTLHGLLGAHPAGGFRHGRNNPLPADLVVLDECSMIDLRLLDALLTALPAGARLVLLGDRDQLDAVEAGNVFGALCEGAGRCTPARATELARFGHVPLDADDTASPINDVTAVLRHSWRFDGAGGIGRLAAAVNAGDRSAVAAVLELGDATVQALPYGEELPAAALAAGFEPLLGALAAHASDDELLERLEAYRVLCALRNGRFGVEGLNRAIAQALAARGLIRAHAAFYAGRPLLVTRNDHALGLYNGDLGLVVPGERGGEQVLFRGADGRPRRLPSTRLPEHQDAFAMTIHKAQGSESAQVCVVLPPPEIAAEFGGREMLYTAITRARDRVLLALPNGTLESRWFERSLRSSGLAERLHAPLA